MNTSLFGHAPPTVILSRRIEWVGFKKSLGNVYAPFIAFDGIAFIFYLK
jgi:hypothetical protein